MPEGPNSAYDVGRGLSQAFTSGGCFCPLFRLVGKVGRRRHIPCAEGTVGKKYAAGGNRRKDCRQKQPASGRTGKGSIGAKRKKDAGLRQRPRCSYFIGTAKALYCCQKPRGASELRIAHGAGMQLHVPDVADACQVHHHPLEAQTEACVLAGAVAPQIAVPPVVLRVHAQLADALLQYLQSLLALAAADDLTNAGDQTVRRRHRLAVIVDPHIKGLDLGGIVGDEHRALEHLLRQEQYADYDRMDMINGIFLQSIPYIIGGVTIWFLIAYFANTSIIKAATGAQTLERKDNKRVYNLVENLCMSQGMKMPKINVINDSSLNAYASGINERTYTVTLSRGIID